MGAAALLVAAVGLTMVPPPQEAHAWAWTDTCTFRLVNEGQQSNVRPILYTPVPPNPISIATYGVLAATGVPTNLRPELSTTGIPVSWGCHQYLQVSNPGTNANCTAEAPTKGANTFKCSGSVSTKIYEDNDNIRGEVIFPRNVASPNEDSDEPTPVPEESGPTVLRRGDLAGKGWKDAQGLGELGELGTLFEEAPEPGCDGEGKDEPEPVRGEGAAFSKGGGERFAGVAYSVYRNSGQARRALKDAVGEESISCLDSLLSDEELGTTASVEDLPLEGARNGVSRSRLVIETDVEGSEDDRTDHLDIVGMRDGKRVAVLMINRVGKPTKDKHQTGIVSAVGERLD